ncbi:hypothetical protein AZK46_03275 [Acinetobacter baumannii]|uniref:hypothetical protein n=1 Tax=Acinetobacter baumannii TaxID=470 RepID=UPI0007D84A0E|nr:hypothetical protein [Acinetobacter baumannii]KAB1612442.1 hypothetical protein F8B12_01675 [Acinetobacter baumannii]OAM14199.1 hypothetical protein AZK46_03275 [Acinetobacter baumannii]
MANILISNMYYTGSAALPNIFDTIVTDDEKYSYVLNTLTNENVYISDINQEIAVGIFNSTLAFKNRVIADGGVIGNYSKLIKAFNYIRLNSLTSFAALSLCFAYKVNTANQLTKLYSLSGANFDAIVDTPTRCKKNGFNIQTTSTSATSITIQSPFRPQNALFGISGEFLSATEAGGITLGTQNTAATSGITAYESIALAALNGISTGTYRNTGNASTARTLAQDRNYNKNGVALLLSDAVRAYSDAYANDLMYSYTTAKQDMSSTDCYVNIRLSSSAGSGSNTQFREAWFIANSTTTIAKSLSQYLNY